MVRPASHRPAHSKKRVKGQWYFLELGLRAITLAKSSHDHLDLRVRGKRPLIAAQQMKVTNTRYILGDSGRFALVAADFEDPQAKGSKRNRQR